MVQVVGQQSVKPVVMLTMQHYENVVINQEDIVVYLVVIYGDNNEGMYREY